MSKDVPLNSSASILKSKDRFLITGCSKIDQFLRGGLLQRGIIQIYGESGSGKTQLALQLCLTAQISSKYSNNSRGVAYICTEAIFPSNRLYELLNKSPLIKKHFISSEKIFIEHISNTEDLENCIIDSKRLPQLLSKHKIKVLVIDSIAATYRMEYDAFDLKNRAKSMRNIGYHLQILANTYEIAIICINQITADVKKNFLNYSFNKIQPSLGISWANLITTSLYMYKEYNRRYLYVAGSSYLPCETIEYEILSSGLQAKKI